MEKGKERSRRAEGELEPLTTTAAWEAAGGSDTLRHVSERLKEREGMTSQGAGKGSSTLEAKAGAPDSQANVNMTL